MKHPNITYPKKCNNGKLPYGSIRKFVNEAFDKATPDFCIIFPGGLDRHGYAHTRINGKRQRIHRYILSKSLGRKIKENYQAAHDPIKCTSRACINRYHIREATASENQTDRVLSGTDCKGVKHWKSKLTDSQIIEIRLDTRAQSEIANDFEISRSNVSHIKTGRRWGHIK